MHNDQNKHEDVATYSPGGELGMSPDDHGDFVLYDDYAALLQKLADYNAALYEMSCCDDVNLCVPLSQSISELQQHRERLESRVRELDLDAARYRFLRDTQTTFGVSAQHDDAGQRIFYVRLHGYGGDPIDVDSAIDAELASEGGG